MRFAILLCSLIAASGVATPAAAQGYRELVNTQLDNAAELFQREGLRAVPAIFRGDTRGSLEDGGVVSIPVQLEAGVEYYFVGVCDQDCSDVDLELTTSDGQVVLAADFELDDVPVIDLRPTASGTYLLRVSMASCDASICYYGVAGYRR